MARANDLAADFLEIDSKAVTVNGLDAAQPPIGLAGMAHNGAGCKQKIHKIAFSTKWAGGYVLSSWLLKKRHGQRTGPVLCHLLR